MLISADNGFFSMMSALLDGVYLSISFRGIRGDTSICEGKDCFTADLHLRGLSNLERREQRNGNQWFVFCA